MKYRTSPVLVLAACVLILLTNVALPLFLGWLVGDVWGVFLLAGVLRLVVSHHVTFFINSLAHMWGSRPYTDENTARDNWFLAIVTYGEGYHNFHHLFQSDYRNGIRWWQFDPTKWLIRSLAWLGLTKNLYRTPLERIETARAQMLLTVTSPQSSQVQAGIWCPHQIWREMHQSRILFIQS